MPESQRTLLLGPKCIVPKIMSGEPPTSLKESKNPEVIGMVENFGSPSMNRSSVLIEVFSHLGALSLWLRYALSSAF